MIAIVGGRVGFSWIGLFLVFKILDFLLQCSVFVEFGLIFVFDFVFLQPNEEGVVVDSGQIGVDETVAGVAEFVEDGTLVALDGGGSFQAVLAVQEINCW